MAKLSVAAGTTSFSVNIFAQNSSSTAGAGLTGFATAAGSILSGLTAYYSFTGANAASHAISLSVPATVGATYSSGQLVEIDATHMAGVARFDVPNAALASGNGQSVTIFLGGGTNFFCAPIEIELTGWNNQDGVHGGMSALPNVASGSSGGVALNTLLTLAGTESYAALHANPTPLQMLYEIRSNIVEFGVSGTTLTSKKIDGSTTATTSTLSDATNPTSRTRAS